MAALASLAPQLTCDDLLQFKPSLHAYLGVFPAPVPASRPRRVLPRLRRGGLFLVRHRQAVEAELGTREGILLVDTTDMPKQGVHSVDVAWQSCGQLGQVANCRAGVFVAYAGEGGCS